VSCLDIREFRSHGVSVWPIITIDGVHEVNHVFLDDVCVPLEDHWRRRVEATQAFYSDSSGRPLVQAADGDQCAFGTPTITSAVIGRPPESCSQ
jgi:hypothetical protein